MSNEAKKLKLKMEQRNQNQENVSALKVSSPGTGGISLKSGGFKYIYILLTTKRTDDILTHGSLLVLTLALAPVLKTSIIILFSGQLSPGLRLLEPGLNTLHDLVVDIETHANDVTGGLASGDTKPHELQHSILELLGGGPWHSDGGHILRVVSELLLLLETLVERHEPRGAVGSLPPPPLQCQTGPESGISPPHSSLAWPASLKTSSHPLSPVRADTGTVKTHATLLPPPQARRTSLKTFSRKHGRGRLVPPPSDSFTDRSNRFSINQDLPRAGWPVAHGLCPMISHSDQSTGPGRGIAVNTGQGGRAAWWQRVAAGLQKPLGLQIWLTGSAEAQAKRFNVVRTNYESTSPAGTAVSGGRSSVESDTDIVQKMIWCEEYTIF